MTAVPTRPSTLSDLFRLAHDAARPSISPSPFSIYVLTYRSLCLRSNSVRNIDRTTYLSEVFADERFYLELTRSPSSISTGAQQDDGCRSSYFIPDLEHSWSILRSARKWFCATGRPMRRPRRTRKGDAFIVHSSVGRQSSRRRKRRCSHHINGVSLPQSHRCSF